MDTETEPDPSSQTGERENLRLLVLDTNVLMHDPAALFGFAEHDVFIPMIVLEELDANKKGLTESARNVRQASRLLDALVSERGRAEIETGIALGPLAAENGARASGRLFLQTEPLKPDRDGALAADTADNTILAAALALAEREPDRVTLVSKDINLRIKGAVLGIKVEDYYNDRVLDDTDLLYNGVEALPEGFLAGAQLESWHERGRTRYRFARPPLAVWPNQILTSAADGLTLLVREAGAETLEAELAADYQREGHAVWGVVARNPEQSYALNLLMDPDLDFVTLLGPAGTGKTLLALAAGLAQTLDEKRYREIIMTRVTVPLGEDIGFLPGTEEEKMTPWMGALMDNLEVLTDTGEGGTWGRGATQDLLASRIKIRSLNFMRGRTFLNRYIIIDEAQNLTAKQIKALVTRAGPGTKMIALGNIAQIDTPYL
ncbi:MAG: PhoH family protein, partial [Gammaproteobacteria bacterium]